MNAPPDEEDYALPPERAEAQLAWTRTIARLLLCPGAGYASVGLPALAWVSYSSWFAVTAAFAWFIYTLDPVAKWLFWGSFAFGLFFWLVEVTLVWAPTARLPAPRFLTRLPIAALVIIWTASFVWGGLLLVNICSLMRRCRATASRYAATASSSTANPDPRSAAHRTSSGA